MSDCTLPSRVAAMLALVTLPLAGCSEDASSTGAASTGGGGAPTGAGSGPGSTGAGGSIGQGGGAAVDACSGAFEGYGAKAIGGAAGDTYHVMSLADAGPGTLRDGVESQAGPRTIVFDVAGAITLEGRLALRAPFLTIDGCSAPAPGITITTTRDDEAILAIFGTHDVILRNLRIVGLWSAGEPAIEGSPNLVLDGDTPPDHVVKNVVIDHITSRAANDAAIDVWGAVEDVTVSWSVLSASLKGGIVSHYPAPFQVRQRLSYHHNVYARNIERNPQIRADVRDFDFVNNVLFEWGFSDPASGYGIRVRNDGAEPPFHGNFVANVFSSSIAPDRAFLYEGTGAEIYLESNVFPPEFTGDPSTIAMPLPVPDDARVITWDASTLGEKVLPVVGVRDRDADEQALLADVAAAIP